MQFKIETLDTNTATSPGEHGGDYKSTLTTNAATNTADLVFQRDGATSETYTGFAISSGRIDDSKTDSSSGNTVHLELWVDETNQVTSGLLTRTVGTNSTIYFAIGHEDMTS